MEESRYKGMVKNNSPSFESNDNYNQSDSFDINDTNISMQFNIDNLDDAEMSDDTQIPYDIVNPTFTSSSFSNRELSHVGSLNDYSRESIINLLGPNCSNNDDLSTNDDEYSSSSKPIPINPSSRQSHETKCLSRRSHNHDDLSYSMIIDDKEEGSTDHIKCEDILAVSPRPTLQWISDDKVIECYKCKSLFSFFRRRHHCRCCGRIFCYECSSNRHYIPENVTKSKNTSQLRQLSDSYLFRDYIRVCDYCNEKIQRLEKLDKHIKVFEKIDLTVDDYKIMIQNYDAWQQKLYSLTSIASCNDIFNQYELSFDELYTTDQSIKNVNIKLWGQISKFFLSAFRGTQYYLPNHNFQNVDRKLLWNNRHYIYNHSKYAIQLIRCFINDTEKLHTILDLYDNPVVKKNCKSCWDLMCSRNCHGKLHFEDLLTIWRQDLSDPRLRQFLVQHFCDIDQVSFLAYLQIIVQSVRYDSPNEPIIQDFILNHIKNDYNLSNQLYWTLKMACLNRKHGSSYNDFLSRFIKGLDSKLFDNIIQGENLVTILQSIPSDLVEKDDIKNFIKMKSISQRIRNPIDIDKECTINSDDLIIKPTITKPIILSFIPTCDQPGSNVKRLLYKGEDIRKDLLIMNLIRLVHKIIEDELKIDTKIVTYDIIPTSHNTGIIEMVDNCETIANIREKKQLTILNYIMNHNNNTSVDIIRNNFMYSCAVYCIVTYLLGIGDRHLDNILVTSAGQLFHVDYSYILGSDPKPFTKPRMRISPEMIDALGGASSKKFLEFEEICTQIYNCLRRHVNLFINVMTFLPQLDPPVSPNGISLDNDTIINEIINRFVPGEGYQQAKLQFHNVIGTSSTRYNQYHNAFIDFFHHHQQEQTLQNALNQSFTGTTGYVNYLYDLVTNYFQDTKEEAKSREDYNKQYLTQ